MPGRSDTTPRLTGSRLCEITGVNRQTRDTWSHAGLLRKGDGYDEFDLGEAVVLKLLLETLRKKDAKIAWLSIRPRLKQVLPGRRLMMVWDATRRSAEL